MPAGWTLTRALTTWIRAAGKGQRGPSKGGLCLLKVAVYLEV